MRPRQKPAHDETKNRIVAVSNSIAPIDAPLIPMTMDATVSGDDDAGHAEA